MVEPPRVSADYVRNAVTTGLEDRLQGIRAKVLSRTRLERMIGEFDLPILREQTMQDAVEQLSENISVSIRGGEGANLRFAVTVTRSDPTAVKKVTERLASMFIDESNRDRENISDNAGQFLAAAAEDARRRLEEYEAKIAGARASGRQPSKVLEVEFQALAEFYESLLLKRHEASLSQNLERRQIGEQFTLIEAARIPETPLGPNRRLVNIVGALSGLGLGLVLVATPADAAPSARGSGRSAPSPARRLRSDVRRMLSSSASQP